LSRHDELAFALLVVVAAPVGAAPGTMQPLWQLAACALQAIMQLVTVELCASRIVLLLSAADALCANAAITDTATRMVHTRTKASSTHGIKRQA
jgi:hypothetical protein